MDNSAAPAPTFRLGSPDAGLYAIHTADCKAAVIKGGFGWSNEPGHLLAGTDVVDVAARFASGNDGCRIDKVHACTKATAAQRRAALSVAWKDC